MNEYVVGRRTTRYETALVAAASRGKAVERARREGRFGGAFEEAEYDVFEATAAEVVELDGRRAASARGRTAKLESALPAGEAVAPVP